MKDILDYTGEDALYTHTSKHSSWQNNCAYVNWLIIFFYLTSDKYTWTCAKVNVYMFYLLPSIGFAEMTQSHLQAGYFVSIQVN